MSIRSHLVATNKLLFLLVVIFVATEASNQARQINSIEAYLSRPDENSNKSSASDKPPKEQNKGRNLVNRPVIISQSTIRPVIFNPIHSWQPKRPYRAGGAFLPYLSVEHWPSSQPIITYSRLNGFGDNNNGAVAAPQQPKQSLVEVFGLPKTAEPMREITTQIPVKQHIGTYAPLDTGNKPTTYAPYPSLGPKAYEPLPTTTTTTTSSPHQSAPLCLSWSKTGTPPSTTTSTTSPLVPIKVTKTHPPLVETTTESPAAVSTSGSPSNVPTTVFPFTPTRTEPAELSSTSMPTTTTTTTTTSTSAAPSLASIKTDPTMNELPTIVTSTEQPRVSHPTSVVATLDSPPIVITTDPFLTTATTTKVPFSGGMSVEPTSEEAFELEPTSFGSSSEIEQAFGVADGENEDQAEAIPNESIAADVETIGSSNINLSPTANGSGEALSEAVISPEEEEEEENEEDEHSFIRQQLKQMARDAEKKDPMTKAGDLMDTGIKAMGAAFKLGVSPLTTVASAVGKAVEETQKNLDEGQLTNDPNSKPSAVIKNIAGHIDDTHITAKALSKTLTEAQ